MQPSPLAPSHFATLASIDGVTLATASCGMKYVGRDDVMLITCADGSSISGVFTTSDTAAAPVLWCQQHLHSATAIITNAGNANAFTGANGVKDVLEICTNLADRIGAKPEHILMASTGVIGEPLDIKCLINSFDNLLEPSGKASWATAADAIRTTDTFAKGASASCIIDDKVVHISGIAKGSGMIAPNMATMLGYVATDAAISPALLDDILADANHRSFNAITVDSDMSTNDSVFLIATGAAGNKPISDPTQPDYQAFRDALDKVMQELAQQIVRDGEGASKFITIDIHGAESQETAHHIGMTIANSPLVKTAIAGEDANWGRIVMAVGKSGANINQNQIAISIGGIHITKDGARCEDYDEAPVAAHMQGENIDISVHVGDGSGHARIWTCDLTHGYISINADYRS